MFLIGCLTVGAALSGGLIFKSWLVTRTVKSVLVSRLEGRLGVRPTVKRVAWEDDLLTIEGLSWKNARIGVTDMEIARLILPSPPRIEILKRMGSSSLSDMALSEMRASDVRGRWRGEGFSIQNIEARKGFLKFQDVQIEMQPDRSPAQATPKAGKPTAPTRKTSVHGWLERFPVIVLESLSIYKRTDAARIELLHVDKADARYDIRTLKVRTRGQGESSTFALNAKMGSRVGKIGWDVVSVLPTSESQNTGLLRWLPTDIEGAVQIKGIPLGALQAFLPDLPWYRPEQTSVDADLVIATSAEDRIRFNGGVQVRGFGLASARISRSPIRDMDIKFQGSGEFEPKNRRLKLNKSDFKFKHIETEIEGELAWLRPDFYVRLSGRMHPLGCQAFIASIPADALEGYRGFTLVGSMQGAGTLNIDSKDVEKTSFKLNINEHCVLSGWPPDFDLSKFENAFMQQAVEKEDQMFVFETGPGTPHWTPLRDISPFFIHAVLAHEDASFFKHHGFSVGSIEEALRKNLAARRFVTGASTITMQLIKNVFLHREKVLSRKVQEALLTWMLEHSWDKFKILELYLNVIEYGPQVYGVRDAARYYFNVDPDALSPAQSVFLATILPNPKLYGAQVRHGKLSPRWAERMRKFLKHIGSTGRFDAVAVEHGLHEIDQFAFAPSPLTAIEADHTKPIQAGKSAMPANFLHDGF